MSGRNRCESCGGEIATAQDVIAGRATYSDTQGGHNDRRTLIVAAADRAIEGAR